jgi:hypothetical protein
MYDSTPDSPTVQIPLLMSEYQFTTVDEIDSDLSTSNWTLGDGYAKRGSILMHRVIMERVLDRPLAKGELVDHWNQNPLDNTRNNLRLATRAQNGQNRKVNKNSKSGYKGVHEFRGRWRATINVAGKCKSLGYFSTPELAAETYNRAALEHFGEFASLNEIREGDPTQVRHPKKIGRPRKS